MKLPKKIRVGAITAKITKTRRFFEDGKFIESDNYFGQTLQWGDEILIHKDVGLHQARSTLFHEIMHLCFHQTYHELSFDEEEAVIQAISPILLDSLQRNPALVKYLLGDQDAEVQSSN